MSGGVPPQKTNFMAVPVKAKAYVALTKQTFPKKNDYTIRKIEYNVHVLVYCTLFLVHIINQEQICQVIHTGLV